MTDPLTQDNAIELVRSNNSEVDTIDTPHTWYLINDTCVMAERETKTVAMTNGVSGRRGGPMPMVSGSVMGTKGQLTVYNHRVCVCGVCGVLPVPIPQAQPYESKNQFFCYR